MNQIPSAHPERWQSADLRESAGIMHGRHVSGHAKRCARELQIERGAVGRRRVSRSFTWMSPTTSPPLRKERISSSDGCDRLEVLPGRGLHKAHHLAGRRQAPLVNVLKSSARRCAAVLRQAAGAARGAQISFGSSVVYSNPAVGR